MKSDEDLREGTVKFKFQIVVMDIFKSGYFDEYPSAKQMKKVVSYYFPTFHANGDPVTWRVEKVYFLED